MLAKIYFQHHKVLKKEYLRQETNTDLEETNTELETVVESEIASGSATHIKEENLGDLTIPPLITLAELSESESESTTEVKTLKMEMSQVEFLKLASSLIPEFSLRMYKVSLMPLV